MLLHLFAEIPEKEGEGEREVGTSGNQKLQMHYALTIIFSRGCQSFWACAQICKLEKLSHTKCNQVHSATDFIYCNRRLLSNLILAEVVNFGNQGSNLLFYFLIIYIYILVDCKGKNFLRCMFIHSHHDVSSN